MVGYALDRDFIPPRRYNDGRNRARCFHDTRFLLHVRQRRQIRLDVVPIQPVPLPDVDCLDVQEVPRLERKKLEDDQILGGAAAEGAATLENEQRRTLDNEILKRQGCKRDVDWNSIGGGE